MSDFPRARVTGPGATSAVQLADQQQIPSHVFHVPGVGDVVFHHAQGSNVGEIIVDHGAPRISLMLVTPGCDCGCGARGRGLFLTPDADEARRIAKRLIAAADDQERAAGELARTIIDKASRA